MDRKTQQILQALRELAGKGTISLPVTVTENYPDKDYVDVEDMAGTLYPEVRKRAAIDGGKGMLLTPVKGSSVIISKLSGDDSNSFVIILFSEIESIRITIGDQILFLNKDGLVLNDGKLGGIIKIDENVKKLNAIEEDLNNLKDCFKTWSPVAQDGGAALKTITTKWSSGKLKKTAKEDLEDSKVKH